MKVIMKDVGYWNGNWNINYTDILTKLIQLAGRCKNYASDILYDLKEIDNKLSECHEISDSWEFGFREYGVDHRTFIDCTRADGEDAVRSRYTGGIYMLTIEGHDDEIVITLYEEDIYDDNGAAQFSHTDDERR